MGMSREWPQPEADVFPRLKRKKKKTFFLGAIPQV
jgi:hypothetical protein